MQTIEFAILDQIQRIRGPLLDQVMIGASAISNHGEIWGLLGIILMLLYLKKTKKQKRYTELYRMAGVERHAAAAGKAAVLNPGITILLAMLFSFLIVNLSLKPYVMRIRPYEVNTLIRIIVDKLPDYSFPSGHASVSFAAATAIFLWNKKAGIVALISALLISFSRLYLYVHFPSDVLAGMIIGILCGLLAYWVHKKFLKRFY